MTFRLSDPAFLSNPAPTLARLRAKGPLTTTRMPIVGRIYLTTTDAAARALLKDDRFKRSASMAKLRWMPRFMAPMMKTLIVRDDPDHHRLRHLVELAFARTTIDDLRPEITARADALLDVAGPGRDVDIAASYTRRLPFEVISTLLGLPPALRDSAARRIAPLSHITNPVRVVQSFWEMRAMISDFSAFFATKPETGLARLLYEARDEGAALSEDELLAMVMTLFLAGHETTVHLINGALVTMLENPDLLAHFRAHPETRHLMIEEFVRAISPVMMTKMMTATEDLEFQGMRVAKGDSISAFLLAANYDPDRVTAPEEMQPERKPNAHMGFGHGPHMCLGQQLARLETDIALDRLFARFPRLKLTRQPDWSRRPGLRARKTLIVDLA